MYLNHCSSVSSVLVISRPIFLLPFLSFSTLLNSTRPWSLERSRMAAQRRIFAVITLTCTTTWSNTTRKEWKKQSPTWRRGLCCIWLADSHHDFFSFHLSFFYATANHPSPFHLLTQSALQFKDIHFLMCLHFFFICWHFLSLSLCAQSINLFTVCLLLSLCLSLCLYLLVNHTISLSVLFGINDR